MIRFYLPRDTSKPNTPQREQRERDERTIRDHRMLVGDGLLIRDDFRGGQSCTAKRMRRAMGTQFYEAKLDKRGRGTVVWRTA